MEELDFRKETDLLEHNHILCISFSKTLSMAQLGDLQLDDLSVDQ